jgi:hypothetical protein
MPPGSPTPSSTHSLLILRYDGQRIGIGASVGVAFAARHLAPKDILRLPTKRSTPPKAAGKNHYRIAAPSPAAETHAA